MWDMTTEVVVITIIPASDHASEEGDHYEYDSAGT